MLSSTEGEAVVTAHDWSRGILFSVLASIIGAASKLSIRKSWLIDKERQQEQQLAGYEEVLSSENHTGTSENSIAPLEVNYAPPNELYINRNHSNTIGERLFRNATTNINPSDNHSSSALSIISSYNNPFNNKQKYNYKQISPTQISWTLYITGMIGMTFLNPLCCVLAMKYANPSILAPFSGLTLVWVVLFSGRIVGETPGVSQKVACALIVLGEVLVAMFGDHTNGEEGGGSVEEVIASYKEPAFRNFILLMILLLIQLCIFIRVCPKTSLLRKLAWGSISGSITGFQNFLKDALTISSTEGHPLPPIFYLFVVLAMLTAFVGLLCLAACMKRYDATYSAAMFIVSFVISASLMSSVHYHTFEHLEGVINYIMYPFGLGILFFGAFILIQPGVVTACISDEEKGEDELNIMMPDESLSTASPSQDEFLSTVSPSRGNGNGSADRGYRERLLNDD